MKITADGSSEPSINFTLEEDFGDVNIMANTPPICGRLEVKQ